MGTKILKIEATSFMEVLSEVLDETRDKREILNTMSYYFHGTKPYISDWRLKERAEVIYSLYIKKYQNTNMKKMAIRKAICNDIKEMQKRGDTLYYEVTERIVGYVLQVAQQEAEDAC